jgi:hypothetical protein
MMSFKGAHGMNQGAAGITGRGLYALATPGILQRASGVVTFGVFTAWGIAAPRRVSRPL